MQNLPESTFVATPDALRSEVEKLGQELAVRRSVGHFAVGLIGSMLTLITFGLSMRLLADSAKLPHLFWPVGVLSLGCLIASLRGFFKGRRLRVEEQAQFRRYLEVRSKAGLD